MDRARLYGVVVLETIEEGETVCQRAPAAGDGAAR